MFVTTTPPLPPPPNYWQCIVVDQNRNYLFANSASQVIAQQAVFLACQNDVVSCSTQNISCNFFSAVPTVPSCTVVDNVGGSWTVQAPYQPCGPATQQCIQAHNVRLQFLLPCRVVSTTGTTG